MEEATGIRAAPYGALILAAWRGHRRDAGELIDITIREAGARGEGIGLAIAQYARAVLGNGLGRYDEALFAAPAPSWTGSCPVPRPPPDSRHRRGRSTRQGTDWPLDWPPADANGVPDVRRSVRHERRVDARNADDQRHHELRRCP